MLEFIKNVFGFNMNIQQIQFTFSWFLFWPLVFANFMLIRRGFAKNHK